MRAEDRLWLKATTGLASIALITSGCASLPSTRGISTMSLDIGAVPVGGPMSALSGESGLGPGKAARAALPPSEMCDGIVAILCAVVIPVAVPVAAVVGAAAKTSQKLPLEQAVELNRVTSDVVSQLNLAASFSAALQAEAQRRGITLVVTNSGARILVAPRSLSWDIKAGNRVALRMDIDVTVRIGGGQGTRPVTYRSGSKKATAWIADDGRRIRETLEETMVGASQLVWKRILGAESGGI